ncbi:hypothetical protein RB597_007675 [Gaeumannomyces tritici]
MDEPDNKFEELKGLWETCQSQDDQKQALITSLFSHVQNLNEQLKEVKRELKHQKGTNEYFLDKNEKAESTISTLVHEKERHGFAVVLIDGDCMPFKDDLVKDGAQGGRQAAHNLKQAVKEQLDATPDAKLSHLQVLVRVYANLRGLDRVYRDLGVLPPHSSLDDFVRGFNMADAGFDFVDAGNGKECSDEKVRAMFRLHVDDVHCRRVFFGGSADNGYARLLGQHVQDAAVCGRVTLLEGPPFAHELADIKDRFRVARMEGVFRQDKLPTVKRRVSFHVTPPTTPAISFASVIAKPASPVSCNGSESSSSGSIATSATTTTTTTTLKPGGSWAVVRKNAADQRVDTHLDYAQADFQQLKQRRLCNNFHLLGECYYPTCHYGHGDRLRADKRTALLAVSRLSPCPRGLRCTEPRCIYGHRCSRGDCSSPSCVFPREMHGVDVKTV